MESNRPLRKVCPQCDATLHVKRAVCGCGYAFPSKRKAQCIAKREAMKCRRTLESEQDELARKEQDRICKGRKRASETLEQTFKRQKNDRLTKRTLETPQQTLHRQEKDRLRKETKRASDKPQQTLHRQEKDRLCKKPKRASKTPEQTLHRQEKDRLCKESKRASEMPEQMLHRQEKDRLYKESKRASETPEQTLHRQEKDRLCKESKKASETPEQTLHRQEKDRLCKESKRASETPEQTLHRQEKDRLCKESKKASETPEQTLHRQEKDRLRKESKKAYETPDEILHRKQTNKECVSNRRKRCAPLESGISAFHSDVKSGPDFVCTCCHRMMYRKSVVQCNKTKYTKACPDVLEKVFSADLSHISIDGREWMCKTCDRSLLGGSLPLQAKANGLQYHLNFVASMHWNRD